METETVRQEETHTYTGGDKCRSDRNNDDGGHLHY